jgi:translin
MSLKRVLKKIEIELRERERIKDELFDGMRKATRLSKQAIFSIHKNQLHKAEELLQESRALFTNLEEIPKEHQKFIYSGIVYSAQQEYAEACIFLRLVQDGKFIDPVRIDVPSTSFLLGLADTVGELRRRTLNCLRHNDVGQAERNLEMMEKIYDELVVLDEAFHAVSELRRKCDIARRIIEITRGDVTIEVRRSSLENAIKGLQETLGKGK